MLPADMQNEQLGRSWPPPPSTSNHHQWRQGWRESARLTVHIDHTYNLAQASDDRLSRSNTRPATSADRLLSATSPRPRFSSQRPFIRQNSKIQRESSSNGFLKAECSPHPEPRQGSHKRAHSSEGSKVVMLSAYDNSLPKLEAGTEKKLRERISSDLKLNNSGNKLSADHCKQMFEKQRNAAAAAGRQNRAIIDVLRNELSDKLLQKTSDQSRVPPSESLSVVLPSRPPNNTRADAASRAIVQAEHINEVTETPPAKHFELNAPLNSEKTDDDSVINVPPPLLYPTRMPPPVACVTRVRLFSPKEVATTISASANTEGNRSFLDLDIRVEADKSLPVLSPRSSCTPETSKCSSPRGIMRSPSEDFDEKLEQRRSVKFAINLETVRPITPLSRSEDESQSREPPSTSRAANKRRRPIMRSKTNPNAI